MVHLTDEQLQKAVTTLRQGGVVVFPTETAYGMAADATNTEAIKRVFAIKGRRNEYPPPMVVADARMAERTVEITPLLMKFARQYWPGPLSLKVWPHKDNNLSSWVKRPDGSVAIRVSSHPVAQALSREFGGPLIATSANKHTKPDCFSVQAVKEQLAGQELQPDMYLDIGQIPKSATSTIIGEENGKIVIHRQGPIEISKEYVA